MTARRPLLRQERLQPVRVRRHVLLLRAGNGEIVVENLEIEKNPNGGQNCRASRPSFHHDLGCLPVTVSSWSRLGSFARINGKGWGNKWWLVVVLGVWLGVGEVGGHGIRGVFIVG